MYDPKHNEFDFWVGTWDVRPRGQPNKPPATGRVKVRLTFFRIAPDTVRQFAERSQPDGTWAPAYDLIYSRTREP